MSRLRKLIPLLAVVALILIAAMPVLAQPALYKCTVYKDGVLVGAGKTVEAFVGTETTARGSATTDADGIAMLQFPVVTEDIGKTLSFKVDGYLATETPDVNVSRLGLEVRLDYTTAVTCTLTVTVSPAGKGSVAKNPNLAQYPVGTLVTLTATAIGGWEFSHWSGDVSGTANPTTVTMNANKAVTANFEEIAPPPAETFAWWLYETFIESLTD